MRWSTRILATALCAALQACVTAPVNAPPREPKVAVEAARAPVTILISIDGFRPDYRDRGVTPNLDALAASGISAAMRPSFPSVTFPNHYTLVTGLRPDRNGIVGNRMEDARRPGEVFTMQTDDPFWWTQAEPLWVTAEKAGIRSATMFWPGSNVDFNGIRPDDWQQYAHAIDDRQRVDSIIDWLRRPAATRPHFLTLYFDAVDSAGHKYGPADRHVTAAVRDVDTAIGRLRDGLAALGQPANLVIVADHGMAPISADRVVRIDRMLPPGAFKAITDGPYVGLNPAPGHETEVARTLLGAHDHLQCWRKGEVPARFHYGQNARVPAFVCLAETGWLALTRDAPIDHPVSGGTHGFDPAAPEMAALFIASGPAIKPLGVLAGFDNVDVAPLLRDLIGLPADTTLDGDDAPFRGALRGSRPHR
ncbi:putative AlkP superfamily pyrophosphatase or phosphodiesterase [Sphingomonas sp. PvP055]|uniref:alkaline phosphatase family protein n=1 Tax=Sphingomonas sp. PvP055 TaxID=3156391 RepID=UPI00339390B2